VVRAARGKFRVEAGPVAVLALPVAVFEIILLPFWLFFRGFKMPEAFERIVATQ